GMIAPLQRYAVRGVAWYQGESNVEWAGQYRVLLPALIRSWREDWGQGPFPFLLVQLAPATEIREAGGDSPWAELREAQWLASRSLLAVALVVTLDLGEERTPHPKLKEPIGVRLALAARALAYGEALEYSGPTYESFRVAGAQAVVRFGHVGGGLVARGGELTGFTIAGPDRKFVKARARIEGETVVVEGPGVPKPVAVRYGWADYPVANLF